MKTATCFMATAIFLPLFGAVVEAGGLSTRAITRPAGVSNSRQIQYAGKSIPLIGPRNSRTANKVTRIPVSGHSPVTDDAPLSPPSSVETVSYEGCATCGDESCDGGCSGSYLGWDDSRGGSCEPFFQIGAGVELSFVKPHYERSNLAFGQMNSDGVSFQTFSDTEFDTEMDVAPRVWISLSGGDQLGLRLEYWQFDHNAPSVSGQPPANGFGSIFSPEIEKRQLSSSTPSSILTAQSALNAYSIDVAATQKVFFGCWGLETQAGIRYARIEQAYQGTLADVVPGQTAGGTRETLDFFHELEGVGPSFGVQFNRPCVGNVFLFGKARGSVLFGDSTSNLRNTEDEDLDNSFTATHNTSRDDVFSIGEFQVGIGWRSGYVGRFIPSAHIAYESQLWTDVGNPSDVEGNLGFYGFNVGFGLDW